MDLTAAFEAQAARVGADVHCASRKDAGPLAAKVLRKAGCRSVALASPVPERATLQEALNQADLVEVSVDNLWPTRRADGGLSSAKLGVAETGSVLLHSSAEDRRVELCVDIHLILLNCENLVATLDEAFAALREINGRPPAYAALVSGPSRSADIERTLTIGIHGPRELHVLLLGDES